MKVNSGMIKERMIHITIMVVMMEMMIVVICHSISNC